MTRRGRKPQLLHDGGKLGFYLIRPRPKADAARLAARLIGMGPVQEVFVTEGSYGFVVKARISHGGKRDEVMEYITKRLGPSSGKAVSHFRYSK